MKSLEEYGGKIMMLDVSPDNVSSSCIRDFIRKRQEPLDVLDKEVYEYVKKNNLYSEWKEIEIIFKTSLEKIIISALEDIKGQNIVAIDTTARSNFFDRVVIATGISNRQTRALAKSVIEKVKENNEVVIGVEGIETGEWVLVDCGDIICHVMTPSIREYYKLEELWDS